MNTDHAELLERLEEFSFDAPDASFPFSAKLACENGWSNHFTKRVIKEYRRFAFLSVAAGHPVSPSEAVDQAWHLHLTYTLNYWKQFCGETLRRPLHHMPSKGGIQEKQKYDDWYQQTLASYRRLFGSEPPADIWPTVEIRKETKPEFARVDRTSHWVIPKPRLKFFMPALVGGSGVLMLLFCCGATMGNGLNPFNWRGPDFLVFYFWLAVICFGMAAWLRWLLRQPAETDFVLHEDLDVSAIAYLNKGAGHAVSTAIANLASKHLLNHLPGTSKLASRGQLPEEYGMLERVIFAAASNPTGRSVSELRSAAGVALQQIKEDLMERGLLVPRDHLKRCIGLPLLLAIVVPLAGIVKILIGLSRDRPVAILVFLTIVAGIVMVVCFARSPRRSRAGAEVLHHFKDKYSQLRYQRVSEMSPPQDAALAVGLFGLSVLQGTSMANYYSTLNPVQWNSGSSGSDFGGSSCGGGGSSCGGGGGGGCGGCGGGGGN